MKTILMVFMLLVVGCEQVEARDEWTSGDTALQLTYTVAHVMDWNQTLHIARNPNRYEERNQLVSAFIGEHPTKQRVNAFCASTLLIHTGISYLLPKPYRTAWQSFWIGVEVGTVQHNREIGLGVSLHF
jgi:hypothetical protein